MDFNELCQFFEQIKQTKGTREKFKLIRSRFKTICEANKNNTDFNFFQILRLFLPNLDRERDSYNMKEAKIARTLIKMLGLPPGHDKDVLSKSYLMARHATDFGDVVHSVLRKYLSNYKTKLTIDEVNNFLDNLTKRKSETEAEELMMNLFEKISSENTRWIIRIILKDLKLGITSNSILNCYHRDGADFYASNNNLKKVCEVLRDEKVRIHELEIEIFEPFRPMLSKKIDASNFKKEFTKDLYYMENKFDGERFQLHMSDGAFRYFSRNGFDYTNNLGKSYTTGIFTPKLKGVFNSDVKKIILDGELMLFNKLRNSFGSKGMTLDVKKLNDQGNYQPCLCVFDVILLNDRILTNLPLHERLQILKTVFKTTKKGVIQLSQVREVKTREGIVNALNDAVANEEEGIILKDPDSIYKYSDRNSGWFKMKLEYFQDVMNDLDLILMGGHYASSTSNTLNSFMVGIRSGFADNGQPLYLSLGKVHSGLSNDELDQLNDKLKTEGRSFENFDSKVVLFGKETPDYYIEPSKSLVLQIRATELIRNTDSSFKTPYTFRFPRVLKIREDKPVDECLTINELLDLTKSNKSVIKLNKRSIELDEIIKTKNRKSKETSVVMPKIYDAKKVSDILEEYTVLIFNGSTDFEKEEAESLIKKAGGTLAYYVDHKVDIILVGEATEKLNDLIKPSNRFDIIDISWLRRVLSEGNLLGYEQEEVYCLGCSYKNILSDELDMFGDSYTVPTNVDKLKRTFEIIRQMGVYSDQNNSIEFGESKKNFEHYHAYFDRFLTPNEKESGIIYDSLEDQLEFQYYYGSVSETITCDVNLIIFNGNEDRAQYLQNYLKENSRSDIKIEPKSFMY